MLSKTQVLIVGAGPSGLAMAIELMRRGVNIRIVDKALPRPSSESRALGTHARTMEIFERFDALEPMLAAGRPVHAFNFYAHGRRLGHLTLEGLDAPFPFILMLGQADTERILLERLKKSGVTVERPVELIGVEQTGESVVARLQKADGQTQTIETDFLIAADGARSTVRKKLGIEFEGIKMQGQYLVDCKIDWSGGEPGDAGSIYFSPQTMLVLGRMPSNLWRVIVSMQQDDPRMKHETPTLELMQELVDEHHLGARLHDIAWASAFYISNRMIDQMRHKRIFLVGDAAHIHSPVGGQGMNTGIQDAVNLAWKLSLYLAGQANDALLESYHAERHPVIEKLLPATEMSEHLLMLQNPLAISVRNKLLSLLSGVDFVQRVGQRSIAGFTVNYRGSRIVGEHRLSPVEHLQGLTRGELRPNPLDEIDFNRAPRPGERAPDAAGLEFGGRKDLRLFEIWKNEVKHQLLIFRGENESSDRRTGELRQIVERAAKNYHELLTAYLVKTGNADPEDDSNIIRDTNGELHRRYGARHECLYLARPDGYIGFRSLPAEFAALENYLQTVFRQAI